MELVLVLWVISPIIAIIEGILLLRGSAKRENQEQMYKTWIKELQKENAELKSRIERAATESENMAWAEKEHAAYAKRDDREIPAASLYHEQEIGNISVGQYAKAEEREDLILTAVSKEQDGEVAFSESFSEEAEKDFAEKDFGLSDSIPVRSEFKAEEEKEKIRFGAALSLSLGAIFVVLAGIVFATTTWSILPAVAKLVSICAFAALLYAASAIAYRKLHIIRTAKTFYILASIYVFVAVIAVGYFSLLGEALSIHAQGRFLLYFIGMLLMEISLLFGLSLFREKAYGFICNAGMGICVTLLVYTFTYDWKWMILGFGAWTFCMVLMQIFRIERLLPDFFSPVRESFSLYVLLSLLISDVLVLGFSDRSTEFMIIQLALILATFGQMLIRQEKLYLPFGILLSVAASIHYLQVSSPHIWLYRMAVLNLIILFVRFLNIRFRNDRFSDGRLRRKEEGEEQTASWLNPDLGMFLKLSSVLSCLAMAVAVGLGSAVQIDLIGLFGAFAVVLNIFFLSIFDFDRKLNGFCDLSVCAFLWLIFRYLGWDYRLQILAVSLSVLLYSITKEGLRRHLWKNYQIICTEDARILSLGIFGLTALGTELVALFGFRDEVFMQFIYSGLICIAMLLLYHFVLSSKQGAGFGISVCMMLVIALRLQELPLIDMGFVFLLLGAGYLLVNQSSFVQKYFSKDMEILALTIFSISVLLFILLPLSGEQTVEIRVMIYSILAWILLMLLHLFYARRALSCLVNILLAYATWTVCIYFGFKPEEHMLVIAGIQCLYVLPGLYGGENIREKYARFSLMVGMVFAAALNFLVFVSAYAFVLQHEMGGVWGFFARSQFSLVLCMQMLISQGLLFMVYKGSLRHYPKLSLFRHSILLAAVWTLAQALSLAFARELGAGYFVLGYFVLIMAYRIKAKSKIDMALIFWMGISAFFGLFHIADTVFLPYFILCGIYIGAVNYVRKENFISEIWISLIWLGGILQAYHALRESEAAFFFAFLLGMAILWGLRLLLLHMPSMGYSLRYFQLAGAASLILQTLIYLSGGVDRVRFALLLSVLLCAKLLELYTEKRESAYSSFTKAEYLHMIPMFFLMLAVLVTDQVWYSMWFILYCILVLFIGIYQKSRLTRHAAFAAALIPAVYQTRGFWLSIGWWIMLLVAGIVLIVFAATNERRKK